MGNIKEAGANALRTRPHKDAIFDNNVLGFHIEYIKTMEGDFDWDDPTLADAIDVGELYMSDERMSLIANHIVQNHKSKTRNGQYTAIFAVSSIEALVKYYDIFKKIKADVKSRKCPHIIAIKPLD